MNVLTTKLAGCLIIGPRVFTDHRGHFFEMYHRERYHEAGLDVEFVQDNSSLSRQGTLRGLHYQIDRPQGKLVSVVRGEVLDIAVDLRRTSPSFANWTSCVLSAENHRQMYLPPGFAHGFFTLSEQAEVLYKCTEYYSAASERTIIWNDPKLGITWPSQSPIVSLKDAQGAAFVDAPHFD